MTGDKRASARFLPLLSLHHFSFSFLLRGALAAVDCLLVATIHKERVRIFRCAKIKVVLAVSSAEPRTCYFLFFFLLLAHSFPVLPTPLSLSTAILSGCVSRNKEQQVCLFLSTNVSSKHIRKLTCLFSSFLLNANRRSLDPENL